VLDTNFYEKKNKKKFTTTWMKVEHVYPVPTLTHSLIFLSPKLSLSTFPEKQKQHFQYSIFSDQHPRKG
jgi:hypothetical protein